MVKESFSSYVCSVYNGSGNKWPRAEVKCYSLVNNGSDTLGEYLSASEQFFMMSLH